MNLQEVFAAWRRVTLQSKIQLFKDRIEESEGKLNKVQTSNDDLTRQVGHR